MSAPPVSFVTTVPGSAGTGVAFAAEFLISFLLMLMILFTSNKTRAAGWTGMLAGLLIAVYIITEAPLSGMSMNPARSVASALPAHIWSGIWIYLTAPVLGMLLAVDAYHFLNQRLTGKPAIVRCAKLNHHTHRRCIFIDCGYQPCPVRMGTTHSGRSTQ